MIMNQAFKRLAQGVDQGAEIICDLIDDYYSSIGTSDEMESLDHYCAFFTKQMATSLIVPVLMAKRMYANEEFARSVQAVYSSFGIAWRLLDDIQDVEIDMIKGTHSSIYVCLDEYVRGLWDNDLEKKKDRKEDYTKTVMDYVLKTKVVDRIKARTCSELESAASRADACDMTGLADELRCLLKPLRDRQGCL